MSNRRTFTSLCLGAVALVALNSASVRAENIITNLTKVADLPLSGWGDTLADMQGRSPQTPKGGLLQVGNDLWFMTSAGGDYFNTGAIVSYNLVTKQFTTQHSFGLADPNRPETARFDGFNPGKTTLALGPNGTIIYTTTNGGAIANTTTATQNGGAVGIFNPSNVATVGVTALFAGYVAANQPRNLAYSTPIYMPSATGGAIYFNTYQGGTADWGTVQKLTLDLNGAVASTTTVADLKGTIAGDGSYGRQAQGGLLQVGNKIYFTSSSSAGGALPTLQVIDTANNDARTTLSTAWSTGGSSTSYSKPIYDAARNAIYTVTLGSTTAGQGGILKWDIQTSQQTILLNSADGSGSNFADPILFGNSIYYVKTASGSGDNVGGSLWRYDLDTSTLMLLYNLKDYFGKATVGAGSGSLSKVVENGVESLYFTTAADTNGDQFGAIYKLSVTAAPEPGSALLLLVGGVTVGMQRVRRKVGVSPR